MPNTLSPDKKRHNAQNNLTEAKPCKNCGVIFQRDKRYSRAYFKKQKYCSQRCSANSFMARNSEIYGDPKDRFRLLVKIEQNGCWRWMGSISSAGYGTISIAGRRQYAHRFSLKNFGSGLKENQMACHTCDNPWCVNPEHLYAGNYKTNGVDAAKRQRFAHQKLNEDDVRKIFHSSKANSEIAKQYGITSSMVCAIKKRRKWRHVDVENAN
jgi:hypothetical protein